LSCVLTKWCSSVLINFTICADDDPVGLNCRFHVGCEAKIARLSPRVTSRCLIGHKPRYETGPHPNPWSANTDQNVASMKTHAIPAFFKFNGRIHFHSPYLGVLMPNECSNSCSIISVGVLVAFKSKFVIIARPVIGF
jgi:hypothetical protein